MTLRAGVDATAWWNPRGDGRFVRNAVRALVEEHPRDEFTLVAGATSVPLPAGARARVAPVGDVAPTAGAARSPADLVRLMRATRGFDAFLSPSVLSWFPSLPPAVVGLHDVNALTLADRVLPSRRDRLLWRAKCTAALRTAARVFTVSEASRADLAHHLGIDAAVVPEAPDPAFAPQPDDVVERELAAIGVAAEAGPIVFAAGISPHKGVDTLLDAYALLGSDGPPPLVIAGSLDGTYASDAVAVRRRADQMPGVVLPGFVSDRALAALYTAASAAVVPSRGEGFGLPAVEAAACGAPPVLSDLPQHRESLGEAAVFFPPGDAVALADALRAAAARRELGAAARAAVARLTWAESGRRLRALLAEVAR